MVKSFVKKAAALTMVTVLTLLAGCGKQEEQKSIFNESPSVSKIGNGEIKTNSIGKLNWDEKNNVLMLESDSKVWSTTPYDYYTQGMPSGRTKVVCTATIAINYISKPGNAIKTIYSSDAISRGKISTERITNGIKVTYYFNSIKVSVPVSYTLENDYLKISVNTEEIVESEQKVYQIAIAPYMASLPNGAVGGYLFVPSGSGALIKTDSNSSGTRKYSEPIYGEDASIGIVSKGLNKAPVALPIFGAKIGDSAICGIIEKGAESASIVANAGDESLGYSAAYPLFNVRGNNQVQINMIYDGAKQNTTYYSEDIHKAEYTVRYYPLKGENANYTGMAKAYRNYLKEQGALKKTSENSPMYLRILGGMMTDRLFAGMPYKKIKAMTNLSQADEIISDIEKELGAAPVVQLMGFGETGLDAGSVAGGFKINNALGGFKEYQNLTKKHKNVYLDFDLVRFKSGAKAAKTANLETAYGYDYDIITGSKIESRDRFKLLARSELSEITEKLNKTAEKNKISGISLSTLGSIAYSDYNSDNFAIKGGLESEVSKVLGNVNTSIMTQAANSYAATNSDHIVESPTLTSAYSVFDCEVPVYQIVYKGYVSMSVTEGSDAVLDAAESGIGLLHTVVWDYDDDFVELPYSFKGAIGVYKDVKTDIKSSFERVKNCLSATNSAEIDVHEILSDGVTKTVFSNGVAVYVNRTDKDFYVQGNEVKANDFICRQEVQHE